MEENNKKTCPFRGGNCLEGKCALWVQVQMATIGPLGMAVGQTVSLCVFPAILMASSSPKAQPQNIQLPNLKIK